eukprot:c32361_g1_i1 orf=50-361(+)
MKRQNNTAEAKSLLTSYPELLSKAPLEPKVTAFLVMQQVFKGNLGLLALFSVSEKMVERNGDHHITDTLQFVPRLLVVAACFTTYSSTQNTNLRVLTGSQQAL